RVDREHCAGLRIHRHGAARQRIAELRFDESLKVEIDVRLEGRRGERWNVRTRAGAVHDAAARIDFDELRALPAAKLLLVLLLQPLLPNLLPRLVPLGAERRELVFADFGDVARERANG